MPSPVEVCRIPSRILPDFVPKQGFNDRTSSSKSLQKQSSSPAAIDFSTVNAQNVVLPNPPPKDLSRIFASAEGTNIIVSFLANLELCLDIDTSNCSISDLQQITMSSNPSFDSTSSQPTSKIQNKRNSKSLSYKSETSSQNLKIIPQRNSIIEKEKESCKSMKDESELQVLLH